MNLYEEHNLGIRYAMGRPDRLMIYNMNGHAIFIKLR